jgi:hypothetical protein
MPFQNDFPTKHICNWLELRICIGNPRNLVLENDAPGGDTDG